MKKFFDFIIPVKTNACYIFTGTCCIYTVWMWLAGGGITPQTVLSFLIVSLLLSLLQMLVFSQLVFKKLRYSVRILLFVPISFSIVAALSLLFGWFPAGDPLAWLIFTGIFLVFLLVLTVVFEIIFRVTGHRYDGLLGEYQSRRTPPQA